MVRVVVVGSLIMVSACGASRPPGPSCAAFVACVAARDAARGTTTNVARFADGGACWTAAEEGATSCETACARGLEVLARAADAPEVCR
jgi:hypothetical protein